MRHWLSIPVAFVIHRHRPWTAKMWGLHKALVVYMTRREFITLFGGAAATSTLPLAAHAWKRQKSSAAIAILRCV
jgi:hypothetical protein